MSTRPLPDTADPEFAPHWAGLREGRLLVPRCTGCGRHSWPPRPLCSACHADRAEWSEVADRGAVYSWTLVGHRTLPGFEPPYAVVLVETDAGVRLLGAFTADSGELRIGLPVTAVYQRADDAGTTLLAWAPVERTADA
ncbi:Zn-ribbon domain-containing OB-fold protein [Streptomyces sp. NPDC050161]|uniref:Zn-ribbon domain-containing OB-fold protein n=1 Tax=Streptomyces sp. NPDC050161 TaxID=3365604 RepID=UPI0037B2D683